MFIINIKNKDKLNAIPIHALNRVYIHDNDIFLDIGGITHICLCKGITEKDTKEKYTCLVSSIATFMAEEIQAPIIPPSGNDNMFHSIKYYGFEDKDRILTIEVTCDKDGVDHLSIYRGWEPEKE